MLFVCTRSRALHSVPCRPSPIFLPRGSVDENEDQNRGDKHPCLQVVALPIKQIKNFKIKIWISNAICLPEEGKANGDESFDCESHRHPTRARQKYLSQRNDVGYRVDVKVMI